MNQLRNTINITLLAAAGMIFNEFTGDYITRVGLVTAVGALMVYIVIQEYRASSDEDDASEST